MISPEILFQIASTGLIFLLFMTGAWKKSITQTIYIISITISFYTFWMGCPWGGMIIVLAAGYITTIINLFRTEVDPLLKDFI